MISRFPFCLLCLQALLPLSVSFASSESRTQLVTDKAVKIGFEVFAPWNILDGSAKEISGNVSIGSGGKADSLRAEVSAQDIKYKAGLAVGGQIVAAWLRANPPTPAKFVIVKSTLSCKTSSTEKICKGSVDGELTIWAKPYNIDVPIEIKSTKTGALLTGFKEIKFGEYGFGDPDSTIAKLKPTIDLTFSIELPSELLPKD